MWLLKAQCDVRGALTDRKPWRMRPGRGAGRIVGNRHDLTDLRANRRWCWANASRKSCRPCRAFNSGHHGGMTTVHADGVNRVPSRLISLGLLAGVSPQALAMLAAGAFDAVVHLERVNGQRRITQIGELRVAHGELAGTPLAVWNGCHPPRYAAEWGHFIERWGIVPGPSGGG